MILIGGAER